MWLMLGGLFCSVTTQNLPKMIGAMEDGRRMLDGSTFLATRYKVPKFLFAQHETTGNLAR